jgi:hypothetical protein
MTDAVFARFFERVEASSIDACWLWKGPRGKGYGQLRESGRRSPVQAHRVAYEHFVGPIPKGLQLDHLCRERWCVNPFHLEPVTNRENAQRGAKGRLVTVCRHGHPYMDENTLWRQLPDGPRRACLTCRRERLHERSSREHRAREQRFNEVWLCADGGAMACGVVRGTTRRSILCELPVDHDGPHLARSADGRRWYSWSAVYRIDPRRPAA